MKIYTIHEVSQKRYEDAFNLLAQKPGVKIAIDSRTAGTVSGKKWMMSWQFRYEYDADLSFLHITVLSGHEDEVASTIAKLLMDVPEVAEGQLALRAQEDPPAA